jgi:hypothetical protein
MLRDVMRRFAIALVLLVGCRRGETSSPANGDGTKPATTAGGDAPGASGDAPPAERCAGGTEWNGKPEGCAYEVDGCCYADAETACAAAKCANEACEILETYPAQVRCRAP